MIYMLDTADLNSIQELIKFFPIEGITTNPTIVAKSGVKNLKELYSDIRKSIGEKRSLHIQALGDTSETIVEEAKLISNLYGENTYIKIPVMKEGIRAMLEIKKQKISVGITATGIMSAQQALMAAQAGANFVAPYVNRSDNHNEDGIKLVSEIARLLSINELNCQILGASFKNIKQVHDTMLAGATSVTVDPELFQRIIYHSITDWSIDTFKSDWIKAFGENKTLLEVLGE